MKRRVAMRNVSWDPNTVGEAAQGRWSWSPIPTAVLATAATAVVMMAIAGSGLLPASLTRAASVCADGWTSVGEDSATGRPVCELRVTESGDVTLPAAASTFDALVVGGGGGGGGGHSYLNPTAPPPYRANGGGGGGGGEVTECTGLALTGTVSVTVGDGGQRGTSGDTYTDGSSGESSSIGTCSADGGAGGTSVTHTADTTWPIPAPYSAQGVGGTSGSGKTGGNPSWVSGTVHWYAAYGGGGGGAGANGTVGRSGANGGSGVIPTSGLFAGNTAAFGGGGGGGRGGGPAAAPYAGGGGFGYYQYTTSGTANTGGGGGGGGGGFTSGNRVIDQPGNGGSGVVVLRYLGAITLYVVPAAQSVDYGSAAPTYTFTLHTGSASGPVVTPTLVANPTCTSDYVALDPTSGQVSTSPRTITCTGGDGGADYVFDHTATAELTITARQVTIAYSGTQGSIAPGSALTPAVTGLPADCTEEIRYSLDVNPLTGATGDYPLTVVAGKVDTNGWRPGTYSVTATYPEGNCASATDSAVLTVAQPSGASTTTTIGNSGGSSVDASDAADSTGQAPKDGALLPRTGGNPVGVLLLGAWAILVAGMALVSRRRPA